MRWRILLLKNDYVLFMKMERKRTGPLSLPSLFGTSGLANRKTRKNSISKSTNLPLFFRFLKKRFLFRGERAQNMWFVFRKQRGKNRL
jgi:hypothetical protein